MARPELDHKDLGRVGRALMQRTDELADEMVRRISSEVPAYSRLEPTVLERVRVLSAATGQAISTALSSHQAVRREDIPIIEEQAADRLAAGVDLDSFLHAYRAALFFYWDSAMLEAGRLRLSREGTRAVGRFVLDAVDTITTHAAEAYLREDNRRRTQASRAVRDLLDSLIAGAARSSRVRDPAAPGLDPTRPMQLIIARVTDSELNFDAALTRCREVLVANLSLGTTPPLSAVRQQEIVVISAGSPPLSRVHAAVRCAHEQHGIEMRAGLSNANDGFSDIPRAYEEAALTVSYATNHRPVIALSELPALQILLLAVTDSSRRLISDKARSLDALSHVDRTAMVETITAFAAASMNITDAAKALYVHPNTVRYRLARIAQVTDLDPRSFPDLCDLVCILELQHPPIDQPSR